nr:PREDICTED: disco-interacting protein 2 homolog C-like [Rhinolophus sinicus]
MCRFQRWELRGQSGGRGRPFCDITQKGYEKKRSKLIGAYLPQPPTANGAAVARCRLPHSEGAPRRPPHCSHIAVCDIREATGRERVASTVGNRPLFYFRFGVDQALPPERRAPITPSSASRYHRRRSSGSRDERYRSDVHTEAVQAALAKHKERKMAVPMPSKRRSLVVQTSMDAYTPPGERQAAPAW